MDSRLEDKFDGSRVTIDWTAFATQRRMIVAPFDWFAEDSERFTRFVMADVGIFGATGQLAVDINGRLIDGRPGPFLL